MSREASRSSSIGDRRGPLQARHANAGVSRTIGLSVDVAAAAGYALIGPYLILALKRVYAESIGVILWKAALVLLLTLALNNLASFAAIRMTIALV